MYKNLFTYLIGHNKPINGFRPAATHPSRRLCFLCAYATMSGLPRFGLSNRYKYIELIKRKQVPQNNKTRKQVF